MANQDEAVPTVAPPAWRVLEEEHLQHCKVFDVHKATMESPLTGEPHPFYRIESPPWVNIVALTEAEELVLIRQFRHGSRVVTLEIPGGLVDPGETPEFAGGRELLEETGYRAGRLESLGSLNPNPALFANRVHMQVALNCVQEQEIQNTSTEHTMVELLPLAELPGVLREGGIDHALVVAALYAFDLWRREQAQ
ncbi:MAG: NUDIX hydrolase [Myxococcota bacterium]|jgi:ADP-ribose pyrophosphatase